MSTWNDETAEWYAANYGEYATNRLAADAVDVAADAVVVDVGCGTGAALRRIAARVPRGRLIGVDPIPRMLAIARERAAADPNGHRIDFRTGAAEDLPVEADFADLVFAFDSIDHWRDRGAGLREVRRVLRRGGRLVVVKDGGLPGGLESRRVFLAELAAVDLAVVDERTLAEGDVTCTMWVCSADG
jgi:ubiquinone/menaquinone biosynthesis C-methylase UbiE